MVISVLSNIAVLAIAHSQYYPNLENYKVYASFFQYNGLLLGLLLASVGLMLGHRFLASSLIFVVLLNMKHIFIYCALPYFVYLLSTFCYPFHKHQVTAFTI